MSSPTKTTKEHIYHFAVRIQEVVYNVISRYILGRGNDRLGLPTLHLYQVYSHLRGLSRVGHTSIIDYQDLTNSCCEDGFSIGLELPNDSADELGWLLNGLDTQN